MGIWITRVTLEGSAIQLKLEGQLVGEWSEVLERECRPFLEQGQPIVLDFVGVTFIDRRGVETVKRLREAGARLESVPPLIEEQLRDG